MPMLTARSDTEAFTFTVAGPAQTSVLAIRTTMLAQGARFAPPLNAMADAMTSFAGRSVTPIQTLLPTALTPALIALASEIVGPAYRTLRNVIIAAKRDDASRATRIHEPPAALPYSFEDRATFRALDLGQKVDWVRSADRSQLGAILVAGRARFGDVPNVIWTEIVDRHAILAHVEKSGIQSDYALKATPDDPAIVGPDTDAAEAAAQQALKRYRDDQHEVEYAENVLRSAIVAVSIATDLTIDDAFTLLNGGAA